MNQAKQIEQAQLELLENRSPLKAEQLLLEVAKKDNGHACHELGVLYSIGCDELKADKEKSVYWLKKSVELGFEQTVATEPLWFLNNAN